MVVSLSSLNRASLAAREMYWWINGAAVILSLMIAHMSWTAYKAAGTPEKALLCITCQLLAIATAVLARRALTAQMPIVGALAGAGALGCAWWASHGLALAWARGSDPANGWMVFFLAAFEPGLFLVAEHVREGRMALRAAQEKADAELATELAAIRERSDRSTERPRLATVGGVSVAVGAALTHSAQAQPPMSDHEHSVLDPPPIVSPAGSYPTARHHFAALMAEGVTKRVDLSRRTGVKLSTASRWAIQWEAGKFRVEDAA